MNTIHTYTGKKATNQKKRLWCFIEMAYRAGDTPPIYRKREEINNRES